jgi:UDP:flavonoid glycosyltransferase YjiC (YdhE family)
MCAGQQEKMNCDRKRVLLFAEAVTLAHVARPLALAEGLDAGRYDIAMACSSRYHHFFKDKSWQLTPLQSIGSQQFLRALSRGSPVYDTQTLRQYVKDDIEIIRKINPDVIVGDFRLSLSVSARIVGIPYITITNAYWSPYYTGSEFPLPVLPMTKALPLGLAEAIFRFTLPLALILHCAPMNRVRRENGLASLGSELQRIYTDADYVLFADMPELFPTARRPAGHQYLGPILWSPPVPKPVWWDHLPTDKPIIYLTLGSSGQAGILPAILDVLSKLPVTVIAATVEDYARPMPRNVYSASYLPGTEAARLSRLVICNGGSPTSSQALAAGVPVLGIASNADQFLNMEALARAGVGRVLRADRLGGNAIEAAVKTLLFGPEFSANAGAIAEKIKNYNAFKRFSDFMEELTAGPSCGESLPP